MLTQAMMQNDALELPPATPSTACSIIQRHWIISLWRTSTCLSTPKKALWPRKVQPLACEAHPPGRRWNIDWIIDSWLHLSLASRPNSKELGKRTKILRGTLRIFIMNFVPGATNSWDPSDSISPHNYRWTHKPILREFIQRYLAKKIVRKIDSPQIPRSVWRREARRRAGRNLGCCR